MEEIANNSDAPPAGPHDELEALKQLYERSLEELAAARREAEDNAQAARAAEDELQYFVYAASHDLQQPLRAIGTHAQLLQREYPSERAREFINVILDGASQMNSLVRDLLNYSRTGNNPQLEEVNLNGPLQWALFNLASSIRDSGAQVTTDELPTALADEKQLVTVFEHLLTNALRYHGPEAPKILVTAETGGDWHTISVRDNGMGIKPEYHERIFEPFKRLHSKEIPGSGLGLAISRKIVRCHHGRIWVESDGEHGSTFKFTLPA